MNVIVSKPSCIQRRLGNPFSDVADEAFGVGYGVKKRTADTAEAVLVAPTGFNDALVFVSIKEGLANRCGDHFKGPMKTQPLWLAQRLSVLHHSTTISGLTVDGACPRSGLLIRTW